jgi:N-acetylglutamate synthase-like GNAT family acetyltransferase
LSPPSRSVGGAAAPSITIRDAVLDDLPRIVALLRQITRDEPREQSDGPLLDTYVSAFRQIEANPHQRILVAERDGHVVGTVAFMVVPNLSYMGRPWAHVENVVIDPASRRNGYGEALMRYAVEEARRAGCYKIVLTSNKRRADAHRFYRRLGFSATHEGFRISFDDAGPQGADSTSR